jgi:hypothetical protein
MSWTDLAEKFTAVTGKFVDAGAQQRLRSALRSLGEGDGAPPRWPRRWPGGNRLAAGSAGAARGCGASAVPR